MLINSSPSTTTSMNNPRQIAVYSATNGAIMYTVPAGKKFVGYISAMATAASAYSITPSGGVAQTFYAAYINSTSLSTTPAQITLVAGTIITSNATNGLQLLGVESDL